MTDDNPTNVDKLSPVYEDVDSNTIQHTAPGASVTVDYIRRTPAQSRGHRWQPGEVTNPHGAPKRGESWAETIKSMSLLPTPALQRIADSTTASAKRVIVARTLITLAFDPSPGLFNGLMDRAEGRVPLAVDVTAIAIDPASAEERILRLVERARLRSLPDVVDADIVDTDSPDSTDNVDK